MATNKSGAPQAGSYSLVMPAASMSSSPLPCRNSLLLRSRIAASMSCCACSAARVCTGPTPGTNPRVGVRSARAASCLAATRPPIHPPRSCSRQSDTAPRTNASPVTITLAFRRIDVDVAVGVRLAQMAVSICFGTEGHRAPWCRRVFAGRPLRCTRRVGGVAATRRSSPWRGHACELVRLQSSRRPCPAPRSIPVCSACQSVLNSVFTGRPPVSSLTCANSAADRDSCPPLTSKALSGPTATTTLPPAPETTARDGGQPRDLERWRNAGRGPGDVQGKCRRERAPAPGGEGRTPPAPRRPGPRGRSPAARRPFRQAKV